jgi:hypothetical protein
MVARLVGRAKRNSEPPSGHGPDYGGQAETATGDPPNRRMEFPVVAD